MKKILKIDPLDNVIVALRDLEEGETIAYEHERFVMQEPIPAKHKFYTVDLANDYREPPSCG
jgi:altronate hydrolase